MKKNIIILLATLFVGFYGFSQDISGVFDTGYGRMNLVKSGSQYTGTYDGGRGTLVATLNSNKLAGTWKNSSNSKSGKFEFIFTSDYSSFVGEFGYNNSAFSKKWNGKRINSTSPSDILPQPKADIADISGSYNTDFKQMTLAQTGAKVNGTYDGGRGTLAATLNGNKLSGTWKNSSNSKSGNFEFVFASDYSSFVGEFGYNSSAFSKKWNGKRIGSTSPSDISPQPEPEPKPEITVISGLYNTTYGQMTLTQTGASVNGIYEGGSGKIVATIVGNKLTGTWKNSSSSKNGSFEFVFAPDFLSFTGKFGYKSSPPSKKWNGTKIK